MKIVAAGSFLTCCWVEYKFFFFLEDLRRGEERCSRVVIGKSWAEKRRDKKKTDREEKQRGGRRAHLVNIVFKAYEMLQLYIR